MTLVPSAFDRRRFLQASGIGILELASLPALAGCAPTPAAPWTGSLEFVEVGLRLRHDQGIRASSGARRTTSR